MEELKLGFENGLGSQLAKKRVHECVLPQPAKGLMVRKTKFNNYCSSHKDTYDFSFSFFFFFFYFLLEHMGRSSMNYTEWSSQKYYNYSNIGIQSSLVERLDREPTSGFLIWIKWSIGHLPMWNLWTCRTHEEHIVYITILGK